MIGLLLPLWLNLGGGGGGAPPHHDAPGDRLLAVRPDNRSIQVEADERRLPVEADDRTIPVHEVDTVIVKVKDSADKLDYTRDFGAWLAESEGISSVSWARTPASGLTIESGSYAPTVSSDAKRATVWLSAGNTGVTYTVTATVTTNNSPARIVERSFQLEIKNQ